MTEPAELLLVYVPVPDAAAGRTLAEGAVRQKLAACGNVLPGMTSVYEWEGQLETSTEALLLLKTTRERADELESYLLEHHPYECPCILRLNPEHTNPAFAAWVTQQTASG